MVLTIYKRALGVLKRKPFKLWGLSLLSVLLCYVLAGLCGFSIPGLALAVVLLLNTSMLMVYLHGYRGEDVHMLQLFECFKDWKTIKRVLLGLGWMYLRIFLWALIPGAGIVFAIIRTYEYRLTPYILVTEPEVSIAEAVELSSQRTNGYKGKMFAADILIFAFILSAFITSGIIGTFIPVLGIIILLSTMLALLVVMILLPLFMGLVQAAFYEEITNPTAPKAPAAFCTNCGTAYASDEAAFCNACGKPRA